MKYENIIIKESFDLSSKVGMGIAGKARFFVEINNLSELKNAINWANENSVSIFVLGGGSNILIGEEGIDGLVISIKLLGKNIIFEDDNFVEVKINSGENWDEIVFWCVENHWWGVENLSHIPGKSGAFVVQNVGAYGQEASQVVKSVEVYNLKKHLVENLTKEDCKFKYRESIFNLSKKGDYIILSMVLKLQKNGIANIDYLDVKKYFEQHSIMNPTIHQVRDAIVSIRDTKLPLPEKIGNNGSFFKNLLLTESEFNKLKEHCVDKLGDDILDQLNYFYNHYTRENKTKVPSAFLIEKCGLKGHSIGGAKVSDQHALVILNHNNATFNDLQQLIKYVRDVVLNKCGVQLEIEPEIIGFEV